MAMTSSPPVALLDACVLYPYTLRDTLMHLAVVGLYSPRWSVRIQQEWMISLLEKRGHTYTREKLEGTIELMNKAFELGCVEERLFLDLIPTLQLKDPNDKHVLAAAIAAKADFLVTFNLKDFQSKDLDRYGVTLISPDEFIANFASQRMDEVLLALTNQSRAMKRWPKTPKEIIQTLGKTGLVKTRDILLESL